jgi:hypothetical protein
MHFPRQLQRLARAECCNGRRLQVYLTEHRCFSSTSDYEGFINDSRDPRVEFGFSAPFASILSRGQQEKNNDGQECILLRDRAKLY